MSQTQITNRAHVTPTNSRRALLNIVAVLHHLCAFAPLLIIAHLYIFSWRVSTVIGHWPRPSLDDPKYIPDFLSNALYNFTYFLIMFAAVGLVGLLGFPWIVRRKYSLLWSLALIGIYIIGWIVIRLDPGDRINWFMD